MAWGRGPTRLISPARTLKSCGSSSRLELRRKRPTRVVRASSFLAWTTWAPFSSTRMERNLKMPKFLYEIVPKRAGLVLKRTSAPRNTQTRPPPEGEARKGEVAVAGRALAPPPLLFARYARRGQRRPEGVTYGAFVQILVRPR